MDEAAPMTSEAHSEWFHGSPKKLPDLLAGSTVSPVITLARAFSHKPEIDLIQHPDSQGAPGEEMLTVHVLPLEFIEEVIFQAVYQYTEEL